MKKITYIILLLLLISCERGVDFPVDADGRIFIESHIGRGEGDRVNIRISQPAYGNETTSAEDVLVYLEADGKPVGLERDWIMILMEESLIYLQRKSPLDRSSGLQQRQRACLLCRPSPLFRNSSVES